MVISRYLYCLTIVLFISASLFPKEFSLKSPDQNLSLKIETTPDVSWSLYYKNVPLLLKCPVGLSLSNGFEPGKKIRIDKVESKSSGNNITAVVPVKRKIVHDKYNELTINARDNYSIKFRVYDDGAAYRFILDRPENEIEVNNETADFNFADNNRTLFPQEEASDFLSHYERVYKDTLVQSLADTAFCSLPALFKTNNGISIVITEADLYDYPNMFLKATGTNVLKGIYPKVILEKDTVSDRDEEIRMTAPYIAKIKGKAVLPWRVIMISEKDGDLLENDLVFRLSRNNNEDFSWVKPGKVAWDWWNALNIYNVDFRSGINTPTYKYYIDFADKFGLDYIILDEGWSRTTHDLLHSNSDLDFKELFSYAKNKNVGIILWVLWNALDENMDKILDQFVYWGAKGIKVDFMQRADQDMVNYYEKVARKAAERKLLVDFHGAYKPSGLNRKYPNVLSFEGVKGLENSKWGSDVTPKHDVTLPFTRMMAGPMDFTPGAMLNANKNNFRHVFSEPMSQGTRCHQAAMYVIYESPLQMLADNPSNYLMESEYTRFIASIPTTWDETIGLDSKAAEYLSVAKRNGSKWYVGAMTDWNSRKIQIPLSFIGSGKFELICVEDGINADKHASDYKLTKKIVTSEDVLNINLAPGGGWAGILTQLE